MIETGVIHGRFQVLHNDHLKYLMAGKSRCRHLVVGITNPDPSLTGQENADPHRSDLFANPFTYYERYMMVQAVLKAEGVPSDAFSIVPFPINFPELLKYYVPLDATFFLTIYDDWGKKKLERFRSLLLNVEVLWERPLSEKGISGDSIRRRIVEGKPWEELVPESTRHFIQAWDIPARLRRLLHEQEQQLRQVS
jgi:nicotinamide mononucleotide adenylyltransferase